MNRCFPAVTNCCLPMLMFWAFLTMVSAEIVHELPLNDRDSLGTVINEDNSVKAEGSGSIRIETLAPTTICLGEVSGLDIDESELLYQAKVKSKLVEGTAYLEMWCHVNGGRYFSRGKNSVVRGSTGWQTLETRFFLQKGEKVEKAVLNVVIEGKGTVWIDAVTLARQPLE